MPHTLSSICQQVSVIVIIVIDSVLYTACVVPAATSHMITIQDLKKAIKVLKMQRKQRMYGTQNQPQADVFDVE